MGETSSIQWTNSSWNPWHGCKKVSDGCKFCYMYRDKERYGQDPTTVLRSKTNFNAPLKWKEPKLVFTCSWSDWFIDEADAWRDEAWAIIKATPHLTYQILTKRPERIQQCLPKDWGNGYPNVWLGVSVENQKNAVARIGWLLEVAAAVRFLSCEPLLGEVDLTNIREYGGSGAPGYCWRTNALTGRTWEWDSSGGRSDEHNYDHGYTDGPKIDWVIVGGESGNETGQYRFRECRVEWIQKIVSDCEKYKIPVFVKQLGTALAHFFSLKDKHGGEISEWNNERIYGRLNGIQKREFPKQYNNPLYETVKE